jgi:hypothetical protein
VTGTKPPYCVFKVVLPHWRISMERQEVQTGVWWETMVYSVQSLTASSSSLWASATSE